MKLWNKCNKFCIGISCTYRAIASPSGRAVQRVGLWALACWECGFKFHQGHGCLSVVSVVCCEVEGSAMSWSLVQRIPTDCGALSCDLETLSMRRPWPTGGCCAKKKQTNRAIPFCSSCSSSSSCCSSDHPWGQCSFIGAGECFPCSLLVSVIPFLLF